MLYYRVTQENRFSVTPPKNRFSGVVAYEPEGPAFKLNISNLTKTFKYSYSQIQSEIRASLTEDHVPPKMIISYKFSEYTTNTTFCFYSLNGFPYKFSNPSVWLSGDRL